MNMKCVLLFALSIFLFSDVYATDKLAVAEPIGKGGVRTADIESVWGILETSIHTNEYQLISRASLKQIMTEIGLTTSSDLVNLNSSQKAKLGQIETVKYILVTEIGTLGSGYNCTMKILDSSTGEIDQFRTANLRVKNFDELADKIGATLQQLLSDNKKSDASAILHPSILVAGAPKYLAADFNTYLENALLNKGIQLQNLQSAKKILQENNLNNLNELEPKMFVKVGELLEVKTLIQATITRFEITAKRYYVRETGAHGIRWIGTLEGNVRIISAQNGHIIASVPFEEKISSKDLDRSMTRDWTMNDCGKYLIKTVIPQKIVPELIKVSGLTGK